MYLCMRVLGTEPRENGLQSIVWHLRKKVRTVIGIKSWNSERMFVPKSQQPDTTPTHRLSTDVATVVSGHPLNQEMRGSDEQKRLNVQKHFLPNQQSTPSSLASSVDGAFAHTQRTLEFDQVNDQSHKCPTASSELKASECDTSAFMLKFITRMLERKVSEFDRVLRLVRQDISTLKQQVAAIQENNSTVEHRPSRFASKAIPTNTQKTSRPKRKSRENIEATMTSTATKKRRRHDFSGQIAKPKPKAKPKSKTQTNRSGPAVRIESTSDVDECSTFKPGTFVLIRTADKGEPYFIGKAIRSDCDKVVSSIHFDSVKSKSCVCLNVYCVVNDVCRKRWEYSFYRSELRPETLFPYRLSGRCGKVNPSQSPPVKHNV